MKHDSRVAGVVGIGLAAITAAALGAYFLYGTGGEQRRKKVRGWMLKARGEVLEQLEGLKSFNQAAYNRVIDEVGSRYKKLKNIDPVEVTEMAQELKGHWSAIKQQFRTAAPARKPAKRTKG